MYVLYYFSFLSLSGPIAQQEKHTHMRGIDLFIIEENWFLPLPTMKFYNSEVTLEEEEKKEDTDQRTENKEGRIQPRESARQKQTHMWTIGLAKTLI